MFRGLLKERSAVTGSLVAVLSAVCFGTLAIFVKFALADGVSTLQLIAWRFGIAAVALWALALAVRHAPWRLPRRSLLILAVMGSTLYSLQAFSYIYAVSALPASLVSLVLYTYPALVAIGSVVAFRKPLPARHAVALVVSFVGVVLLVGGAPKLVVSPHLLVAGLAPLVYTLYILAGEVAMRDAQPVAAATVVMSAAAVTFIVVAALGGQLKAPPSGQAFGWLLAIGLVPTVAAIALFLAALPLIGSPRTALLSTFEPLVTVGLAAVLLGERLAGAQALGALVLLGAVAVLQWPEREPKG